MKLEALLSSMATQWQKYNRGNTLITITEFNESTLTAHTPLTCDQALKILALVSKKDSDLLNKILAEAIAFKPAETYFERLSKSLMLGEVQKNMKSQQPLGQPKT